MKTHLLSRAASNDDMLSDKGFKLFNYLLFYLYFIILIPFIKGNESIHYFSFTFCQNSFFYSNQNNILKI